VAPVCCSERARRNCGRSLFRNPRAGAARTRHPRGTGRAHARAPEPIKVEAPKASIPKTTLDGLVANASVLFPAAILEMESEAVEVESSEILYRMIRWILTQSRQNATC
jgi:hypothetical protein